MTNVKSLYDVITEIKRSGYDYAYIDDNGIQGTINAENFKDVEIAKYYYNDGNEYIVRPTNLILAQFSMERKGLNVGLLKKITDNAKSLYLQKPYFYPGKTNKILYLLKNNVVIGYVEGNSLDSKLNELGSYEVYIDYVFIIDEYRGKKLCKLMVQLFLLSVNDSSNKKLSFLLINAGKEIACKCYFNAFNECGYTSFLYSYDVENDKLVVNQNELVREKMSPSTCDSDIDTLTFMGFLYSGSSGGKTNKTKKLKMKHTKRRVSKNSSRKINKTRTNKGKNYKKRNYKQK